MMKSHAQSAERFIINSCVITHELFTCCCGVLSWCGNSDYTFLQSYSGILLVQTGKEKQEMDLTKNLPVEATIILYSERMDRQVIFDILRKPD